MDDVKNVLRGIGAANGVEIEFDDAGACALPLADGRFLQIQVREGLGEVDLVATLGEVPEEVRGPVFQALLAANYYWKETLGATLSWHLELEQAILSYPIPYETTDEATLGTVFGNFLKLQEEWAKRLRDDIAEAQEQAKAGEDEEDDDPEKDRPSSGPEIRIEG